MQVQVQKLHFEMDSIEKGIVELVSQHGIRKLVMGAAADKHYKRYRTHKNFNIIRIFTSLFCVYQLGISYVHSAVL